MSLIHARSTVQLTLTMCNAEALSMTGFAAYTTLLPVLMREWGISNSEAGAIGGIFYAGYMAVVPVRSSLTDRVDSRRVYLAACFLSSIGAAGFALFAGGFWSALLFQFLFGVVLDLAGGNQEQLAWDLAFASIGMFGALVPVARWAHSRSR